MSEQCSIARLGWLYRLRVWLAVAAFLSSGVFIAGISVPDRWLDPISLASVANCGYFTDPMGNTKIMRAHVEVDTSSWLRVHVGSVAQIILVEEDAALHGGRLPARREHCIETARNMFAGVTQRARDPRLAAVFDEAINSDQGYATRTYWWRYPLAFAHLVFMHSIVAALVFATTWVIINRLILRRRDESRCASCNYSRAGLPAGAVCPECGAAPPLAPATATLGA